MGATENTIDQAIAEHAAAAGWAGTITGWVVLVSTVDHDGEVERSGVSTIYPGGDMPWPFALGIVEAGRARMRHDYVHGEP